MSNISVKDKNELSNEIDNRTINTFNAELFALPTLDRYNEDEFIGRLNTYFEIVAKYNMKPTLASLGLAFGVSRHIMYKWCNDMDNSFLTQLEREMLRKTYALLTSSMEDHLMNGKINPVSAIFLMKNNFNYTDKSEIVTTTTEAAIDKNTIIDKYNAIDID